MLNDCSCNNNSPVSNSVTYLTSSAIKNAQFNVELEHEKEDVGGITTIIRSSISSPTQLLKKTDLRGTSSSYLTIKWQQKLSHPCSSTVAIARTYEPQTNNNSPNSIRRIFTYVDGEQLQQSVKLPMNDCEVMQQNNNSISERFTSSRNRRIAPTSSVRNAIIDLPLKEHMRKSRNIIHSMQTMFIMAYLGPLDRHRESCDVKDEHIICKITSIDGTMIIFEPKGVLDAGIRIESRYGIYNATVTVDDIKFDQLSMIERDQDLDWMHKGDGSDTNSNTFDITDEGITKIDYLLQIDRALNFVHDGLYVEYRIELPPGNGGVTEAVNTGVDVQYEDSIRTIISGKTQICCTKTYEKDDVASFAHLIRFSSHLETKPSELIGNEYDNNSTDENWLLHHQEARLLVRICAESDWGRYYVDGYGMLMLPITPGRHHLTINCWRPVDRNNRHAKLKERFVAQASDLINSDHLFSFRNNDNKWSRIGLTTEGSGQLEVICDCIVQSRQFISSTHLQHLKYGTMMNRIGLHSNLHWRILKALMDFEEAKKHLLKVRSEQPVPKLNFNL